MPAKSKKQFNYMQALAHGSLKSTTLTPKAAAEFISGQSSSGLPKEIDGKRIQRDRQARKAKKVG